MENVYVKTLETVFPALSNDLNSVNVVYRAQTGRMALDRICQGIFVGMHTPESVDGVVICANIDFRDVPTPDINEIEKVKYVLEQFALLGYVIGQAARSDCPGFERSLPFIAEAVEFASQKLGCVEYCSEALKYLSQPKRPENLN
jgi:hypothetical protein